MKLIWSLLFLVCFLKVPCIMVGANTTMTMDTAETTTAMETTMSMTTMDGSGNTTPTPTTTAQPTTTGENVTSAPMSEITNLEQTISEQSTSEQTSPEQTVSEQTTPEQTTPEHSTNTSMETTTAMPTLDENVTSVSIPGIFTSEQTTPVQTASEQTTNTSMETTTAMPSLDENVTSVSIPGIFTSEQTTPVQTASEQTTNTSMETTTAMPSLDNASTPEATTREQTTAEQTTTSSTTTMATTTGMPTLGVSCTNDSSCMAPNSSCYMNDTCKCDDGFLQVSPTKCLPVSALQVQVNIEGVSESEIRISWTPPLHGNVSLYDVRWVVSNTSVTNSTQIIPSTMNPMLTIQVDEPGEEVRLYITVVANDSASDEKNFTTKATLTARPAKPMFNYAANDTFDAPNPNITWTQRKFFDGFDGNVTDKSGMVVYNFTTSTTNHDLNHLIPGMMYNLTLRARRNNVYGMPAVLSITTNPDEPSPPQYVVLQDAGQRIFTLNVTEPSMPNGELQGYVFKLQKKLYRDENYTTAAQEIRTSVGTGIFVFNMSDFGYEFIVPGAFYTVMVYSQNERFNSSTPAILQDFRTQEAAPGNVSNPSIKNENKVVDQAIVIWDRPSMPNGIISAYQLVVRSIDSCIEYRICIGQCTMFPTIECSSNINNFTNLTDTTQNIKVIVPVDLKTSHNATIKAYTSVGPGPEEVLSFESRILVPGKVQNLNPSATTTSSVTLVWSAPSVFPGPTTYSVMVRSNISYTGVNDPVVNCNNINGTTCPVTGLQTFWRYTATITAKTEGGNSTTTREFTTSADKPGKVSDVQIQVDDNDCNTFILSWRDPPLDQRHSFITTYKVYGQSVPMKNVESDISNTYTKNQNTYSVTFSGLQDSTNYQFQIMAIGNDGSNSRLDGDLVIIRKQVDCGAGAGTIAAIVICFILILVIALGVIFFLYRWKLKKIEERYRPQHNNATRQIPVAMDPVQEEIERQSHRRYSRPHSYGNPAFSVLEEDIEPNRPFLLSDAQKVFEKMSADSNRLFSLEYEDLKKLSSKYPADAANMEGEYNYSGNKAKNRYVNILPFDHSRVTLTPIDEDRCSDYINANYIPGYTYEREFIASQGPLEGTVDDFWRMVWEKSVSIIIMLTKCKEGNADKCAHYWPHEVNEPIQYGDIVVNVISVSNMDKFDINIFHVTQGDYTRTVKHFQFLEWPDFSASVETGTIIDFVQTVRTHITPEMKGPAIVHCSAGVGRTGTYISIDYLLQFVRDNDFSAEVDIFDWVLRMRKSRCSMVQVEKQYIFIHMALLDLIERKKKGLIQDDRDDGLYINNEIVYENTAYEGDDDEAVEENYENCEKKNSDTNEQQLTEL